MSRSDTTNDPDSGHESEGDERPVFEGQPIFKGDYHGDYNEGERDD